jgi:dTMP kinase
MTRGLFLALDGLDGTGKSTQCRLLANWLRARGRTVTECADPGGTAVGDKLRQLIFQPELALTVRCEALLFMASRAQLVSEVIQSALAAGNDVVSDRFLLANVVYQGYAGGLDPEELWQVGRFATGGIEPDLTIVLDLPAATAAERRGRPADHIEGREVAYHARVRSGFLAEARRQPERIQVIDATGSIEDVHRTICAEVTRILKES